VPETPFPAQFRQARQEKQLTQAEVAEVLEVSQSAVAQWESGRSFPSAGLAARIEKLLGIDHRLVEKGQEPPTPGFRGKRARLPIVGLPDPADEERIVIDGTVRGEILAPPQLENVRGAKAVYVRGRAMEPRYYAGEVVYLRPDRAPNPGDFVLAIVKEPDYPANIGYIRQYLGEDLINIHLGTLNPKRTHLVARQNLVGMETIVGSGLF
jgi:transcriptional regulator with XRE-family HTH domain